MPRRSGGRSSSGGRMNYGGMRSRGFTKTAPPKRTAKSFTPPPRYAHQTPGFMGILMQGMAFGAGSEIAHQAVRGIGGTGSHDVHQDYQGSQAPQEPIENPCISQSQTFLECLNSHTDNIGQCQNSLDLFNQCRQTYQ
ncbi:unnamed protein product [Blepharisma stoltei]|uniref:CHCH domain-containing protein n=1 Tax=Blepharisma stoltei TaxID=1481888 RepID=A0AAU9IEF4_9CILI|nr:unnamed protein product [Blepharisma stoltei]